MGKSSDASHNHTSNQRSIVRHKDLKIGNLQQHKKSRNASYSRTRGQ